MSIAGTLPPSWGSFKSLTYLNLENLNLLATLPPEWGLPTSFEKLNFLYISNCSITGQPHMHMPTVALAASAVDVGTYWQAVTHCYTAYAWSALCPVTTPRNLPSMTVYAMLNLIGLLLCLVTKQANSGCSNVCNRQAIPCYNATTLSVHE